MLNQISYAVLCWLLFLSAGPSATLAVTVTANSKSTDMIDGQGGDLFTSEQAPVVHPDIAPKMTEPVHPDMAPKCFDTPHWHDKHSYQCKDYEKNSWCKHGIINPAYAKDGAVEHCCVCGKEGLLHPKPIEPLAPTEAPTQAPTQAPGSGGSTSSQPINPTSSTNKSSCGQNCNSCNGDKCTQCKNSRYLSSQGVCVAECPPGFINKGNGVAGRTCELCNGKANRRRATTCSSCGNGEIMKADSDECQNIQDTCQSDQCTPCKNCLENLRSPLTTCLNGKGDCFHYGNQWCPVLMTGLMDCQGVSLGCFYKILCYSPCVCQEWKTVNCGGRSGGSNGTCSSLLELAHKRNVTSQKEASLMRRERADGNSNALSLQQRALSADLGNQDLDATLNGKCNNR